MPLQKYAIPVAIVFKSPTAFPRDHTRNAVTDWFIIGSYTFPPSPYSSSRIALSSIPSIHRLTPPVDNLFLCLSTEKGWAEIAALIRNEMACRSLISIFFLRTDRRDFSKRSRNASWYCRCRKRRCCCRAAL